jgi:hypothetical protein
MPLMVEVETTATFDAAEKPRLVLTVLSESRAVFISHAYVSDPELSIFTIAPRKTEDPEVWMVTE